MGLLEGFVAAFFSRVANELAVERKAKASTSPVIVVDVGCRYGWAGHLFASIYMGALENLNVTVFNTPVIVYGLDISHSYLSFVEEASKLYRTIHIDLEKSNIPLPDNYADLVFAIEVIEHLNKEAGWRLLGEMERIARPGGYIYLTTPNGWHGAKEYKKKEYLHHKSAWSPHDFQSIGYAVKGYASKHLPKNIVANLLLTLLARKYPGLGYGLEAWKKKNSKTT